MLLRSSRCAPKTTPRQCKRRSRRGEQQARGQGQRHRAQPVPTALGVSFLAARGIRPAAGQQATRTRAIRSRRVPPCEAAAEQRLHRQMSANAFTAFQAGPRAPASIESSSSSPTRSTPGEIGAHRLDQTRIAIDQKRLRVVVRHEIVDRQRAVPGELVSDRRQHPAYVSGRDTRLCLIASPPPQTWDNLPISVKSDHLAAGRTPIAPFRVVPATKLLHQHPRRQRAPLALRSVTALSRSLFRHARTGLPRLAVLTDILITAGKAGRRAQFAFRMQRLMLPAAAIRVR